MHGTEAANFGLEHKNERNVCAQKAQGVNVGRIERFASIAGGSLLALFGLKRRSIDGIAVAILGGSLIYRGASGHCPVYEAAGVNTAENEKWGDVGLKVEKKVMINRPAEELYQFWRNFENLPHFMKHLESVRIQDGNRSHWVVKAPLGQQVEWDAEIINEKENHLIAWRSTENADIESVGSVNFLPAPGGRGTEVRITLQYDPPGGAAGVTIAKLFGEEPEKQLEDDLRRFKQLMEAGEIPTTEGQPQGHHGHNGHKHHKEAK